MGRFHTSLFGRVLGVSSLAIAGFLAVAASAGASTLPSPKNVTAVPINLHAVYKADLGTVAAGKISGITRPRGWVYKPAPSSNAGCTESAPPSPCPIIYNGGVVEHSPGVYLLFWGPNWTTNSSEEAVAGYLENFYSGLGVQPNDNWSLTASQYTDKTNLAPSFTGSVLKAVAFDTSTPPTGASQLQLATEAVAYYSWLGISAANLKNAQIIVATQSGTDPAGFGTKYCAWHSAVSGGPLGANELSYTNLPYLLDAGASCGENAVSAQDDGFSIVGGHEFAEAATDPVPNTGWVDTADTVTGGEIGDKCAWTGLGDVTLTSGKFAMQPLFSNYRLGGGSSGCDLSGPALPNISSVAVGNGPGLPIVTIAGTNLSGVLTPVGVTCNSLPGGPDYGDSLYIADNTSGWTAGLGSDCEGLEISSYTNQQLVLAFNPLFASSTPLISGNSYTMNLLGRPFTSKVAYATVTGVAFTGSASAPTVTVTGSGFGTKTDLGAPYAPCTLSNTGSDYGPSLNFDDTTASWEAGLGNGGTDCVGLKVSSYSATKIVYTFGSKYAGNLNSGDSYHVNVLGTENSGTVAYTAVR